jgi:hypothetical protein
MVIRASISIEASQQAYGQPITALIREKTRVESAGKHLKKRALKGSCAAKERKWHNCFLKAPNPRTP